jgi:hypothetical protein
VTGWIVADTDLFHGPAGSEAAPLTRHGRRVASVFHLLGRNENDLTAALGFTLDRSPALLRALVEVLMLGDAGTVSVSMEVADEVGRTDLELRAPGHLVVVEAKQGWDLPSDEQLEAYAERVTSARTGALVTLSQASIEWAATKLPSAVLDVPVRHLPWSQVRQLLMAARPGSRGVERLWLVELDSYLRRAITVREIFDCWTYCVVVSDDRPGDGGARTFRDFVEEGIYFHPFGTGGWPKEPPNFMGFGWADQVQRIHRVVQAEVVPTLQHRWPDIPRDEFTERDHNVYELGPALPGPPIPSGRNYRATSLKLLLI